MRLAPWLRRRVPVPVTVAFFAAFGAVLSPVWAQSWLQNRRQEAGLRTLTALEMRVHLDERFAGVSLVPMSGGVTVVCGRLAGLDDLEALNKIIHSTAPSAPVTCSLIAGRTDVPDRFFQMMPAESTQWLKDARWIERRRNSY